MKISVIEANQDLGVHVDGANLGPHELSSAINNSHINVYTVNKPDLPKEREKTNLKKNLIGVNLFNEALYRTINNVKEREEFPITLGGDHSLAIGSALGSIKKEESLGIIWIDAHSDYNLFETTRTGNLHGLPLAAINGQCQDLTGFHNGNYYNHQNTVIVGVRDIDPWERPNLEKDHIKLFTTEDIHNLGVEKVMTEAFEYACQNTNGVHISYDIDVIDPIIAPGVSVPVRDGITESEAYQITDELIKHQQEIKSLDIVEYNPTKDINDQTKTIVLNILTTIIDKLS